MKETRKIIALAAALALVLTLVPVSGQNVRTAKAQEEQIAECVLTGNTGAVITAASELEVTTTSELVTIEKGDMTATVTATEGAVGIAEVEVTANGQTQIFQIPVGYTTFALAGDKLTVYEGADTKYEVSGINAADEEYTVGGEEYTLPEAIDGSGNKIYENTDDYSLNIQIKKKGGTYVFFGSSSDMSISVGKEATNPAVLLFAGLDMTSQFTAPVTIKKNSESTVTITALEGFDNTLTDVPFNSAETYGAEDDGGDGTNPEYAESACIKGKAKSQLTLNGKGILNLNCVTKNALKVGEYGSLTIEDVTLNITSEKNGISSDNLLTVNSGKISVDAKSDAIRTDPDTVNAEEGCAAYIEINGGEFTITAGSDGIQSAQDILITGGTFDITTGAGYDDANFDGDTMSCKGIKATLTDESEDAVASNKLTITGGNFKLNCADDAVHSDFDMEVKGGEFDIYTGDDAFHADNDLVMGELNADNVFTVDIHACYEGLEGIKVTVNNGKFNIVASDDGINAADGSQSNQEPGNPGEQPMPTGDPGEMPTPPGGENPPAPPTGDPGEMPTPPGGDNPPAPPTDNPGQNPGGDQPGQPFADDGTFVITINGGAIYIAAGGDGIDSNGSIYVNDGTLTVFGDKTNSAEEPFDCEGSFVIKGGTVFGAGSYSFGTLPTNDGQAYITMRSRVSANDTIRVKSGDTEVFSIVAIKDVDYAIFSCPEMTSADGWTIAADNGQEIQPTTPPTGEPTAPPTGEPTDEPPVEPQIIVGDLNGDEKINTADAVVVLKYSAEMITLDDNQLTAGDCNRDEKVNTADAVLILKYAAEMITEF